MAAAGRVYYKSALLLGLVLCPADGGLQQRGERTNATGTLTFKTSDADLGKAFEWARLQALAYAFSGDPVGDWYEAALPGRQAFCMRDVAHQAMGAHALGLDRSTHNMLHRFAENIAESRDWCSYWEIDRYNRPSAADYKNDGEFWYCLPANYDILDACYRMFVWTGDYSYINDPIFVNFYDRSVTSYEERWSLGSERIMKRNRQMNVRGEFDPERNFQVFRGHPSYDEGQHDTTVGVDLLATQYSGYLAYAGIQDGRRDEEAAGVFRKKAAVVRAQINSVWWNGGAGHFYSRINGAHQLDGKAGDSVLYRDVVDDGPKLKAVLDDLLRQIRSAPASAVEVQSHRAEILYRYGAPDAAYGQIVDLARENRERRDYPEVSFSIVGAIVSGLMGIHPDAAAFAMAAGPSSLDTVVKTFPELGKIDWAELDNMPVRDNEICVRHEGVRKTVFTNERGPSLLWRASFPGVFQTLTVDGQPKAAHVERLSMGRDISWIEVPVGPGGTRRAEIPVPLKISSGKQ